MDDLDHIYYVHIMMEKEHMLADMNMGHVDSFVVCLSSIRRGLLRSEATH